MPIQVNYSPIAAAMRMGQQAGGVQDYWRRQGIAEQRRSQDIQTGLAYDKMRQDFIFNAERQALSRSVAQVQAHQFNMQMEQRNQQFIQQQQQALQAQQRWESTQSEQARQHRQMEDYRQQIAATGQQRADVSQYRAEQQYEGPQEYWGGPQQKALEEQVDLAGKAFNNATKKLKQLSDEAGGYPDMNSPEYQQAVEQRGKAEQGYRMLRDTYDTELQQSRTGGGGGQQALSLGGKKIAYLKTPEGGIQYGNQGLQRRVMPDGTIQYVNPQSGQAVQQPIASSDTVITGGQLPGYLEAYKAWKGNK